MTQIETDMSITSLLYKMHDLAARMKSHRGDLMVDAATLAFSESNAIVKNGILNTDARFIWQVREAGTCFHEIDPDQMEMIRACVTAWPQSDFFLIELSHGLYTISALDADEVFAMLKEE